MTAGVSSLDTGWKAALLASGHAALDTPGSLVRPLGTLFVGLLALAGVVLLPVACLPGLLLVVAGVSSNMASLLRWHTVPNPLALAFAGGTLHFNLADVRASGVALVLFLAEHASSSASRACRASPCGGG